MKIDAVVDRYKRAVAPPLPKPIGQAGEQHKKDVKKK